MSDEWQYQLRVYLPDGLVEVARGDSNNPALGPLADILARHDATMLCQFDAFAGYVAEAERRASKATRFMLGPKRLSRTLPRRQSTSNPLLSM